MTRLLIETHGIEKRFGAHAALRGLDVEVHAGRVLALVGPNGAGKSTLLKLLAGLSRPTAGQLVRHEGARLRADVGYLGHATLLYAELTARENLELIGRLHRLADPGARAQTLLKAEGLDDVADRRAGDFSRGMAQRLSIARSLVQDPALLLLDEPFTGLDLPAADRLAARVEELRAAGHGIVLVTHDIRQAAQIADEVVSLQAGRVAFKATGDDLEPEALARRYAGAMGAQA